MSKHSAIRNWKPNRYRECYACGQPQTEARLRPFGRNIFDEPVTWVCDGCADHAAYFSGPHAPTQAAAR